MAKITNPFEIYKISEKVVHIKELNADIKLRDLTMKEADEFSKRLLKNYTGKGEPTFDMNEATEINYEKVALAMIEPKMTVAELKALPSTAYKAINEIIKYIDGRENEDEESTGGNEN